MRTFEEEERRGIVYCWWSVVVWNWKKNIYETFSCLTDRIRLNVLIISFYFIDDIIHLLGVLCWISRRLTWLWINTCNQIFAGVTIMGICVTQIWNIRWDENAESSQNVTNLWIKSLLSMPRFSMIWEMIQAVFDCYFGVKIALF